MITAAEFYEQNATNVIKVPRPGHPEDQRGWDGVPRACEAKFVAQDALVMTLPEAFEFAAKFVERAIAESQAPQPQCDCYAVFGNHVRPHFHDCPAGLWQNVPAQYKQNRWAFDHDEKNSTFFVHSGGHRICDAEDSEVASAICAAFNISFLKG